jgi:uncharacterized protein (TIGR02145 family)
MKQTMIKFIISFFICAINVIVHSQQTLITNVDTNYLRPKWQKANLAVTTFQNGENLTYCDDIISWRNAYSKREQDLLFISNNQDFYYNYTAIVDERKLCPFGYKIPELTDFYNSKFEIIKNINSQEEIENSVSLNPTGFISQNDIKISLEEFPKSDRSTLLATLSPYEFDEEYFYAIRIFKDEFTLEIEEIPFLKQGGLSIRCISDLDEIIQDSTFEYKKLLPTEYRKLLYNLYSETKKNGTSKEYVYQLKGDLNCERNGLISGRFFSDFIVYGKMEKELLLPQMNEIIQDFHETPYYHGEILKAHSDLSLVFKLNTIELEKETFYLYMLKTQKVNGLEELNYAEDHSFNINEYKEILKIEDDGIVAFDESINYLSSFKSRGPVYAIGSVIPGLGMTLLTQDNFNSNRRKAFKKTLLISSISLGAISLGSKLISNFYYNRYKDNLFGIEASDNYKKANTLQKVFLTTGIGYCILGAIDFTATFAMGRKNKSVQNKLNNQIKGSPADFILK